MFQKAFVENYLKKIQKVKLTKQNIADHLLSIVSFRETPARQVEGEDIKMVENDDKEEKETASDIKSQTSVGIVTNYKV